MYCCVIISYEEATPKKWTENPSKGKVTAVVEHPVHGKYLAHAFANAMAEGFNAREIENPTGVWMVVIHKNDEQTIEVGTVITANNLSKYN